MQVTAAVVDARGGAFRLRSLDLAEPEDDEVLVRVMASGICQTDVHGRDAYYGTPFPCVFGHEGAGIVERAGAAVTNVTAGDRVIMFAPSCGQCLACTSTRQAYCALGRNLKMSGLLRSGVAPLRDGAAAVHGAFFQQSSFATHALATARNVVRVHDPVPFEVLAALPCGANTGAGALMHVLDPEPGASLAVFGCGTVGLSGLMAARQVGCAQIIAVDLHPARLALARELGATHAIDASREDPVAAIRAITSGGTAYALEAAGEPRALRQAVDALAVGGVVCLVGSARPGVEASIEMSSVQHGKTIRGCIQGDSLPALFLPQLIRMYAEGRFPIERLITPYAFDAIEQAVADMVAGRTIKAVLRIGSS